jgi:hypothetical protein
MKIVINKCHGGYGLSHQAMMRYAELKGIKLYESPTNYGYTNYYTSEDESNDTFFSDYNINRDDPLLVQVVEELGELANGDHAELKIVEIPYGIKWEITEYDGIEHIAEVHRTWS